ncbi:selenoprotein F [Nilaparvata lugens]|uniref:Selenoprotein F n=1 Tax=Nilaparvata lugens TaxID=108931 RepID=A0A1I9WLA4_NILLU|nr:selenoprotein F [Nilaparvata lugens]APA33924.1 seminal fluid protein [Nilaparvata lugens]
MERPNIIMIILCVALPLMVTYVNSEFSAEDCWALGLNKANLLCSSCDILKKHDLEFIRNHCTECCHHDETGPAIKRYSKAILEVCTCKFGAYPQIQAFVKSDRPAKFPNLQIRYVRGLDPIIKLIGKDGDVEEVLAIEKWNTDSVEEFLNTHLESSDKDSEPDYLKTNQI